MAEQTNWQQVQAGMDILLPPLVDYLVSELKATYGDKWLSRVQEGRENLHLSLAGDEASFRRSLDLQRSLKLFDDQWNAIFRRKFSINHRNWCKELQTSRNALAHKGTEDCSREDAGRALDTMARFCQGFDANSAARLSAMVRAILYGSANGSTAVQEFSAESKGPVNKKDRVEVLGQADSGLPSWREVIQPHPDVANGTYRNAEFAADLAQVASGTASMEYQDPVEFFARTYVTSGMRRLLVEALKRVTGQGGEPVIQLKTAFGGGKTHSMLALYHLLGGKVQADDLPNAKETLLEAGVTALPRAHVAVLVGTALEPASTKRPNDQPGITINTIWGEMAAQLAKSSGNPKLYDFIKESDKKGVSPGSEVLAKLFDACGPCLILIDELVAYARKIGDKTNLPAGTFENLLSFVQELTEAARRSKYALVAVSIPESSIEIGGAFGQRAQQFIENVFKRMDAIWQPVAAQEGFEVVRRRLFLDCKDTAARDRVCRAFHNLYVENETDFPFKAKGTDYLGRMEACYPIHPEVFDRLYEEWSTLDTFQRTRGVLRLMAEVIHELWMNNDGSTMIMPGTIPMDAPSVRNELSRYLGDSWNAVFTQDTDGKSSVPYQLDRKAPRYGQCMAARRVARTVMLGSAPTARTQQNRGILEDDVRLGTVQPGENIVVFSDALHTLRGELTYLYANNYGRYWYDTKPNLRKTMQERAKGYDERDIEAEIKRRLERLRQGVKASGLAAVHVFPDSSADVPDEQAVRLVILPTKSACVSRTDTTQATNEAMVVLCTRGSAQRLYRNMLVFLAADAGTLPALKEGVRDALAWRSIYDDREGLNLDPEQVREARLNQDTSSRTVEDRLMETYRWLLTPFINVATPGQTQWEPLPFEGSSEPLLTRIVARLRREEKLIDLWAPSLLQMELDNHLWKEKDALSVKELWAMLCSYCYLPRLADFSVLEQTIRNGVAGEAFALAAGQKGGEFQNLRFGTSVGTIYPSDLLVKSSVALAKRAVASEPTSGGEIPDAPTPQSGTPTSQPTSETSSDPKPKGPNRFFLSKQLDNTRATRDAKEIISEIVSSLQLEKDCRLEVTLEVHANVPDQFSECTIRTVTENCQTLKIQVFNFERDS